ncbi:hypothetical protein PPL_01445 [Heterostelium album PN500]|uniref:Cytochrome b5 heme-binding domain-containing protein n=1 Tax=Heterostelium pallidum (strain ATCC 26659 / Pp 5 / PN500) TaxID=670386 RepID=D3AZA5_HETP5|nr:hypothetical protein PPL_01445 [Heterostelium album PN500]EFA85488.1 hypothetical protein PPL_01445 [Heterostelium album PN500]|eukprot:XP_020437596.1 hypothetical protein PPL_01445 [Heterostelium album PN500]
MDILSSYLSNTFSSSSPTKNNSSSMLTIDTNNNTNIHSPPTQVYYTIEDVKKHNKANDLWMVLYDKVYNLTEFLNEHPGGSILLKKQSKANLLPLPKWLQVNQTSITTNTIDII